MRACPRIDLSQGGPIHRGKLGKKCRCAAFPVERNLAAEKACKVCGYERFAAATRSSLSPSAGCFARSSSSSVLMRWRTDSCDRLQQPLEVLDVQALNKPIHDAPPRIYFPLCEYFRDFHSRTLIPRLGLSGSLRPIHGLSRMQMPTITHN
jgi:hypothetical protein